MPSCHLIRNQHPGTEHPGHIAGHIVRQIAVADLIFRNDREMIFFRDATIEQQIFATLSARPPEPAVEAVYSDESFSADQSRAAIANEIAFKKIVQHLADMKNRIAPDAYLAVRINPSVPAVNKTRPFSSINHCLKLLFGFRRRP